MAFRYPYLITSDQHAHAWSQFSTVGTDGVNSRLNIILYELERAYQHLLDSEGDTAFFAGDLFHVRGKIEPSVFNPTVSCIADIHGRNALHTVAIPGNHDLEGKEVSSLGNAMQQLENIDGVNVAVETTQCGDVIVIPWHQDLTSLRKELATLVKMIGPANVANTDVIIHAPVNSVIKGIPDHGLEPDELAAYGFRRVFAGHFHDHKVFCDGKVISIGATTHQTWGDVGTKAGFILVYEDHIEHFESKAPKFIDLNLTPDADIKGNYVRARLDDVSEKEIKKFRQELEEQGAAGINLIATKKVTTGIRSGAASKSVHCHHDA